MGQSAGCAACEKHPCTAKFLHETTELQGINEEEEDNSKPQPQGRNPAGEHHFAPPHRDAAAHDSSRSSSRTETESSTGTSTVSQDDAPNTGKTVRRKSLNLKRQITRLAAGHGGNSILKDFHGPKDIETGVPEYVIKTYDEVEATAYRDLEASGDELLRFTARFCGEMNVQEREALAKDLGVKAETRYMRLSNLMKKFARGPHVMDCKIGTRSFRETERQNTTARPDLYQRLLEADPQAPTVEEREARACTKYRWMSYNDRHTCLDSLGFRIDGIAHSKDMGRVSKNVLKQARSVEDSAKCIVQHFLPEPAKSTEKRVELDADKDGLDSATQQLWLDVTADILSQLKDMRQVLQKSAFARSHEFVGSSLLFIADANGPQGGVFLIDFAKVTPLPSGVEIDHETPWVAGNHEDGILIGIDNMIRCWEQVFDLVTEGNTQAVRRKWPLIQSNISSETTDLFESNAVSNAHSESTTIECPQI